MLFNSAEFLFAFLPMTLLGFYVLGRYISRRVALGFLVAASLFFYGFWRAEYLILIVGSTVANYGVGRYLAGEATEPRRKIVLIAGVGANLALLGYYKYTGFLLDTLAVLTGATAPNVHILLPLGISFFTFQQIAYLVDAYRGLAKELNLPRYALFVAFFPQLIAGPIVHHRDVLGQFQRPRLFQFHAERAAVGLTLFLIGLCKKIMLADGIAVYASPVFAAAEQGVALSTLEAWGGALAYTFQLYFDFSGYSDMALGLGRLFGIRLPQNFNSPYRTTSIIEFWRCWHITLSRFLADYLYIPLGGNRKGKARRYLNLFATMLLGGLWHGAGWNYVIWGGLHGLYLSINHGFRALAPASRPSRPAWMAVFPWALTFSCVVVAWVFFRAPTFGGASRMLRAMFMLDGLHLPSDYTAKLGPAATLLQSIGVRFDLVDMPTFVGAPQLLWIAGLSAIALLFPNACELTARYRPAISVAPHSRQALVPLRFRMTPLWALATGVIGLVTFAHLQRISEFLYFQF